MFESHIVRKLITLSGVFLWPTGKIKGLVTLVKNFADSFEEGSWILNTILLMRCSLPGMLEHRVHLSGKFKDDFNWITATKKEKKREREREEKLKLGAASPELHFSHIHVLTARARERTQGMFVKALGWWGRERRGRAGPGSVTRIPEWFGLKGH